MLMNVKGRLGVVGETDACYDVVENIFSHIIV